AHPELRDIAVGNRAHRSSLSRNTCAEGAGLRVPFVDDHGAYGERLASRTRCREGSAGGQGQGGETCALQEFAPVGHAEPPSFNRLCMSKGRVSAGVPSNAGTDESSSRSTLPGRNVPLAGATVTEGSGAQSESI